MTYPRLLSILVVIGIVTACGTNDRSALRFSVQNQLDFPVTNAAVTIDLTQFAAAPADCRFTLNKVNGNRTTEIPSQCDDLNGDGRPDVLFFISDFTAGQQLDFELKATPTQPQYVARTQAFLKIQSGGSFEEGRYRNATGTEKVNKIDIPNEQVQGSAWAHMEGPVWESDLVGYRFYLDARNRVDIFGKSMPEMVLDTITQNYHLIHNWGTDVLGVGTSLGMGSLAAVQNGVVQTVDNWSARRFEIPVNGPLRSIIRMTYSDWNVFGRTVDVVSELEIHAGNRYTEHRVTLTGNTDGLTLATGIVKHPPAEQLFQENGFNSTFAWTSGKQAYQGDGLAMGVVIPQTFQPEFRDNAVTHLYAFRPVNGHAVYRYTSAWELDHEVVTDFESLMRSTAGLFSAPPLVVIKP
jgi:hypothetical protein